MASAALLSFSLCYIINYFIISIMIGTALHVSQRHLHLVYLALLIPVALIRRVTSSAKRKVNLGVHLGLDL